MISSTDKEAVFSRSRDGVIPQYNTQTVVDDKHKLIMYSEATTDGNDRRQLKKMVEAVEDQYGCRPEVARADSDYFNTLDIQELEEKGTECFCNIPRSAQTQGGTDERGQQISFEYDESKDEYRCSQGKALVPKYKSHNGKGRKFTSYQGTACNSCPIKDSCTTSSKGRSIRRYEDEQWKQDYIKKMESERGRHHSKLRKANVEHPYGTIKMVFMDRQQLKMRGQYKVQTEICLYHFAYNLKRMQKIASFEEFRQQIQAFDFQKLHQSKKKAA